MTSKAQQAQQAQKEAIQNMLMRGTAKASAQQVVERALIRIFERQTADEQASDSTQHHNSIGFTGLDAEFLTKAAKGVLRYGHLTERQFPYVQRKLLKYWRQLAEVAAEKGKPIMTSESRKEEDQRVALVTESDDLAMRDRLADKRTLQQAEADEEERVQQYKMARDSSALSQVSNVY